MRFFPSRFPLASLGSVAGLALALSACADPLAPTAGAAPDLAPSLDLSAAATIDLGSTSATVWVCPEADAFSASTTNCYAAFEVDRNQRWNIIPGTEWISNDVQGDEFYSQPQDYYFYKLLFNLPTNYAGASLDIDIFADNAATLWLNGTSTASSPFGAHANQSDYYPNYGCGYMTPSAWCGANEADSQNHWVPAANFDATSGFTAGTNVLTIRALNAVYVQGCANTAADPDTCDSATGLNFTGTVAFELRGDEGCTPGYWKQEQHFDSWTSPYDPTDLVSSVFTGADTYAGITLDAALDLGGGSGVEGARRILLRAAVAALLNSASPDVDYTMTTAEVIAAVNGALASNDRSTMLALAAELDADNNGGCPLN